MEQQLLNIPLLKFNKQEIKVTPEQVARYFGGNKYKLPDDMKETVIQTIDKLLEKANPAFIYSLYKVEKLTSDRKLVFKNGISLMIPEREYDPGTKYIAAGVCSLGTVLESPSQEASGNTAMFDYMLLDAVGVSLIESLGDKCFKILKDLATSMQLFTGCRFGPGYGDMPMESQADLFKLVDAESIGVRLNKMMVMEPAKSLSFFVNFTTEDTSSKNKYKCKNCGYANCQFRITAKQKKEEVKNE